MVGSDALKTDNSTSLRGRLQWRRIIPVAILAVCIVVWLTPAILARTGLRGRIVDIVFPAYTGESFIGSARVGWTTPVVLRDVTLRDAKGRVWLTIPEVASSKSLWALIFGDSPDLGTFTLVRPVLTVRLRDDGSDFEDYLWEILVSDGTGEPTGLTVKIEQGTARWIDAKGNEIPGGLEQLDATIQQPADTPFPGPVEITAIVTDGEVSGPLKIEIDEPASKTLDATVKADTIPLATLTPWLDRFGIDLDATGNVSANLAVSCPPELDFPISINGRIDGQQLRTTVPIGPSPGPLLVERAALHGKITHDGQRIHLEKVAIESDLARFNLNGTLDPQTLIAEGGWKQRVHAVLEQDLTVSGALDLERLPAALAAGLPPGKSIESGRVRVSLRTSGEKGVRRGEMSVTTSDLVASLPDRQVTWESPFTLNVVLKQDANGLSAERLHAEADFVKLDGSITDGAGDVTFEINLDQLRTQLSRFIPIGEQAMAGRASGNCRVERLGEEPGVFKIAADALLKDFAITWAGGRWTEKELRGDGTAVVRIAGRSVEEIRSASATLRGTDGDEVTLTLIEKNPQMSSDLWSIDAAITGELSRWMMRMRSWSILPRDFAWKAGGLLNATARVIHSSTQTRIQGLKGSIKKFHAQNGSVTIDEPQLTFGGDLIHDAKNALMTSENLRVECESIGIQAKTLVLPLAGGEPMQFQGAIRGSLSELARLSLSPKFGIWPAGVVTGDVELSHGGDATDIKTRLKIERPSLSRRAAAAGGQSAWQPIWSDKSAALVLDARYLPSNDQLAIKTAHWQSEGATIDIAGQVEQATTRANAAIKGRLSYDWAKLRPHIPSLSGNEITVTGQGTRDFSIRGPLFSSTAFLDPALQAQADLGWQRLILWGLPLAQGEIKAQLGGGRLALATSRVPVAGGSLQLGGNMATAIPLMMSLDQGRVVDRAQLTPEMCRAWLGYAAPLLADVTDVRGTASLDLSRATVPLLNPAGTRADGVLSIERVIAEPGPTIRSVLKTVQQVQQIAGKEATRGSDLRMTAPAQQIRLTLANGRVHHDRFLVRLGDEDGPTIQTSGSVGFDDSLNLVAEIPLDPSWFRDERLAKLLGGQMLRIPIGGTLSQPIPDPRALQEFSRRAATGAVKNLLEKQLMEGLGEGSENPLQKLLGR